MRIFQRVRVRSEALPLAKNVDLNNDLNADQGLSGRATSSTSSDGKSVTDGNGDGIKGVKILRWEWWRRNCWLVLQMGLLLITLGLLAAGIYLMVSEYLMIREQMRLYNEAAEVGLVHPQ